MEMNIYLVVILAAMIGEYAVSTLARVLNRGALNPKLPQSFVDYYDTDSYAKSQAYARANMNLAFISSSISLIATVTFILWGGFVLVDDWARSFGMSEISTGLLFFGILGVGSDILGTPLGLYQTFVIEERFGFNKMTLGTYLGDKVKGYVIGGLVGAAVLSGILFFLAQAGPFGWLYAWAIVGAFIVLMPPLYTSVIAPMFNKFVPLENGELRELLDAYAKEVNFPLTGVFVMDGSKRSSHSNAYFSGFGKRKRIALFDTLVEQHSPDELLAILAHEIGHYKKNHVAWMTVVSIAQIGILFGVMSLFLGNEQLFAAFGMETISTHAGLMFFGLLYSPVSFVLGIGQTQLSRKHEYEADAYAAETLKTSSSLIAGLKRLSVKNLGNLTPHWFTVWLSYSHPTVLQRIRRLSQFSNEEESQ